MPWIVTVLPLFLVLPAYGADLIGTGRDRELRIGIYEIHGSTPDTKEKTSVTAKLERSGKALSVDCLRGFRVERVLKQLSLQCEQEWSTHQKLRFEIVWTAWGAQRGYTLRNIRHTGASPALHEALAILFGPDDRLRRDDKDAQLPLALHSAHRISAFNAGQHMINAAADLLGRHVLLMKHSLALRAPITAFYGTVAADFTASVHVRMDVTKLQDFHFSDETGPATTALFDGERGLVRPFSEIREDLSRQLNIN